LSRGASEAVLVESAPKPLAAIRANLQKARLSEQAEVLPVPVQSAIPHLHGLNRFFDIIFLDPPYESGYAIKTIHWLAQTPILAANGIIAVELPASSDLDIDVAQNNTYAIQKEKIYGRTKFVFLTYVGDI
jgi:16S rRNA (guanine966-N2)-methyltransferase